MNELLDLCFVRQHVNSQPEVKTSSSHPKDFEFSKQLNLEETTAPCLHGPQTHCSRSPLKVP